MFWSPMHNDVCRRPLWTTRKMTWRFHFTTYIHTYAFPSTLVFFLPSSCSLSFLCILWFFCLLNIYLTRPPHLHQGINLSYLFIKKTRNKHLVSSIPLPFFPVFPVASWSFSSAISGVPQFILRVRQCERDEGPKPQTSSSIAGNARSFSTCSRILSPLWCSWS